MPILEDTKEIIVLTKEEWEELVEFNLGEFIHDEYGVSSRERKVTIKNIRCLVEEDGDIFYPYIIYYDEKGVEKTERLVQVDNIWRIMSKGENLFQSENHLDIITEYNKSMKSRDCIITDTRRILSWILNIKKRLPNLSQTYFPHPVIIRHKQNFKERSFAQAKRDSYFIIPLDLEPEYLGECKYRG